MAIITGASQGVGKATALKLDREGLSCVLVARDIKKLKETAKLLSGRTMIFSADVSKKNQIQRLVSQVLKRHRQIDILVNNAGISLKKSLENTNENEFDMLVNTNLRGVFNCTQAVFGQMKIQRSGQIINIASILVKKQLVNRSIYIATKFAVAGFGAALSAEARKFNIKIATIYPGLVANERYLNQPVEVRQKYGNVDINSALKPEDVAHAIWMIITQSENSNITEVIVDNLELKWRDENQF